MADAAPPLQSEAEARRERFKRSANQFKLLLIGAGFLVTSITVSRRSAAREIAASFPKFYTPNRTLEPLDKNKNLWRAEGPKLAARALGLATLNTMAFGMLLTGGIGWAFDLSSMQEVGIRTREAMQRTRTNTTLTPEQRKKEEEEARELWDSLIGDKFGVKMPEPSKDGSAATDTTTTASPSHKDTENQ
ncbi:hypothetical protein N3K66_000599 [Trichothecium roseum]|uniref:Uncharacterized protein n=1 Tax=Trichothecium roseum TaxID=47278 RepID=A0ACC0VEE8_9HYPO|nr:hypothetical protein N3K66_000599 [Trichothecium roseum]